MKVLVLTTMVPFTHGGAEELCDHLVRNLCREGVQAEAMALPFTWNPADRLVTEMLIARSLRIVNVDRLIALKFPAYLADHPSKTVWLLHQFRQAYDLRDAGQSNIPDDPAGREVLGAIHAADRLALGAVDSLFANSPVTARRLRHYCGIEAAVLPPPLNDPELFQPGPSEGYLLATGRINAGKRQHMLLDAVARAPGVRLVIAGPPDTPADERRLRQAVDAHGLADRVQLELGFLPRPTLAGLVRHAQAVAYLPFDEDSPGYVTMEAFEAAKPVITLSDCGGVLELVADGLTGWVCPPTVAALADALAEAAAGPAECRRRGAAARDAIGAKALTWRSTIDRLLGRP